MAFQQYSTFDDFWAALSHHLKNNNRPSYHPCCRVWVSRHNKTCRASHISKQLWRDVLLSMSTEDTDHKTLMHAHMVEHHWGTPIRFNAPCTARVSKAALNQALEKPQTPPTPQPAPEPLHLPYHHPVPASPQSSPAQLQDLPPQTHLYQPAPADPPRPCLETDSHKFDHR